MRVGLLFSKLREDDEMIIREAYDMGVDLHLIDVGASILSTCRPPLDCDIYLGRCTNGTHFQHSVRYFESMGKKVVNTQEMITTCSNKFYTSLALERSGVPVVPYLMVFSVDQALEAVELLGGFPVVIKPVGGAWGRLISRVNDRETLEALVEHKLYLAAPVHSALYMQPYVRKPGRDIRVTVVGNRVLCAIYRESDHWITNTARGAQARPCRLDENLQKVSENTASTLGEGIMGIDIFETPEGSYMVNEVNQNPEFKNVQLVTGVSIASDIVSYTMQQAR